MLYIYTVSLLGAAVLNYLKGLLTDSCACSRFFLNSSLFRRISIKANVGNIAMHSFFKIILFSEITNFSIF